MKSTFMLLALLLGAAVSFGQQAGNTKSQQPMLGLKAGLNFSNVTGASSINASSRKGFMAGAYFAPGRSSGLGFRTELIFSRQGFDYSGTSTSGSITQDYLLLPQLTTFTIARRLQIQLGGQMGILLNAKDQSTSVSAPPSPYGPAADYFKRVQFGLAGGLEVFPFKNLLIGGRANFSLGQMNEAPSNGSLPPYIPADKRKLKENTVQLYIGYGF